MSVLVKDPWSPGLCISHLSQNIILFSIQNRLYCFSVLTSVETTLGHLHQCGICHACLSLKQSWHQEGRAHSSCPHCPEPPYRPGYMGRTMHKDLQAKHTLLNSFHTVGWVLLASSNTGKHTYKCRSRRSSHTHLNSSLTFRQRRRCTVWRRPEAASWSHLTGTPLLQAQENKYKEEHQIILVNFHDMSQWPGNCT